MEEHYIHTEIPTLLNFIVMNLAGYLKKASDQIVGLTFLMIALTSNIKTRRRMNHGYCKNCWWYAYGWCYFEMYTTKRDNYCPDYLNRKRGDKKGTLQEWIDKNKDKL